MPLVKIVVEILHRAAQRATELHRAKLKADNVTLPTADCCQRN
ncbi:hypothetical protein LX77_02917 [Gelidibacter algens]|uniref:Uncharacterized protein n=1 Tax=Gelidibacter algens TaxID=49280 RepID=A0A327RZR9_9FLAO|nr:hypothetical protein LX77_02917 [Gelidibacter algens]